MVQPRQVAQVELDNPHDPICFADWRIRLHAHHSPMLRKPKSFACISQIARTVLLPQSPWRVMMLQARRESLPHWVSRDVNHGCDHGANPGSWSLS